MGDHCAALFYFNNSVLPDGPTSLGHPANEDLFAGTPVRAATSWLVYLFLLVFLCPLAGRGRRSVVPVGILLRLVALLGVGWVGWQGV